jgi:hypothetical protein
MNTALLKMVLPILGVMFSLNTIAHPAAAEAIPTSGNSSVTRVDDFVQVNRNSANQSAQGLITQPKTLTEMFGVGGAAPTDRMDQLAGEIPSAGSQVPKPITPSDALSDPVGALQRFLEQEPPPKVLQPLELFKIPDKNLGVMLDVWKF